VSLVTGIDYSKGRKMSMSTTDPRENPPTPTWTLARVDWLQVGDIVKLPNPPFGRVVSIRIDDIATAPYGTPWKVYDIGIDAHEWLEASGGMTSVFQILRRGYEAIEWWRSPPFKA
jgi:hypothetical protein